MVPTSSKEFLEIQANYRVCIHLETRTWHHNKIHSNIWSSYKNILQKMVRRNSFQMIFHCEKLKKWQKNTYYLDTSNLISFWKCTSLHVMMITHICYCAGKIPGDTSSRYWHRDEIMKLACWLGIFVVCGWHLFTYWWQILH